MSIQLILVLFIATTFSCSRYKKKEESGSIFSDLQINEIISNRAVYSFKTSVPTRCVAEYGLSEDNLDLSATDPEIVEGEYRTDHVIPLEDLTPESVYYIRAKAVNEDGAEFLSQTSPFTTIANTTSLGRENLAALEDITITGVSSNFGDEDDDSAFGINNAFDGSFATDWASSGDGDSAFVQFEFSSESEIGGFGFRSRKMADGTSIISKVRLIFDDVEYATLDLDSPDNLKEFNFTTPVLATKVRVEAVETTGGNTGAKEIRFYPPAD